MGGVVEMLVHVGRSTYVAGWAYWAHAFGCALFWPAEPYHKQ